MNEIVQTVFKKDIEEYKIVENNLRANDMEQTVFKKEI
jgi:hypothetical protein